MNVLQRIRKLESKHSRSHYIIVHGGDGDDSPPTPEEIAEAKRTGNCFILRGLAKELIE